MAEESVVCSHTYISYIIILINSKHIVLKHPSLFSKISTDFQRVYTFFEWPWARATRAPRMPWMPWMLPGPCINGSPRTVGAWPAASCTSSWRRCDGAGPMAPCPTDPMATGRPCGTTKHTRTRNMDPTSITSPWRNMEQHWKTQGNWIHMESD